MVSLTVVDKEIAYLRAALGSNAVAKDTLNDLRAKFYANPPYLFGTGSPEGVVAASLGSIYVDQAATNGAIQWTKKSGAGNTGWSVSVGDTGWRRVTAFGSASITGSFLLRRNNDVVDITYGDDTPVLTADGTIVSADSLGTLSVGFRPATTRRGAYGQNGAAPTKLCSISNGGVLQFFSGPAAGTIQGSLSFLTRDAWPSTLPGSAA